MNALQWSLAVGALQVSGHNIAWKRNFSHVLRLSSVQLAALPRIYIREHTSAFCAVSSYAHCLVQVDVFCSDRILCTGRIFSSRRAKCCHCTPTATLVHHAPTYLWYELTIPLAVWAKCLKAATINTLHPNVTPSLCYRRYYLHSTHASSRPLVSCYDATMYNSLGHEA